MNGYRLTNEAEKDMDQLLGPVDTNLMTLLEGIFGSS